MILRHMWTGSNHCTNPSPFFIVLGKEYCYGIFLLDNTYKTTFDFGYENTDYYFIEHEKGNLDYYFMPGKDMAEVVGLYTSTDRHHTALSEMDIRQPSEPLGILHRMRCLI